MAVVQKRRLQRKYSISKIICCFIVVAVALQLWLMLHFAIHVRTNSTLDIDYQEIPKGLTSNPEISKVAYAVSITSCKASYVADAAAVLKHSVELSSYPRNKNSSYSYQMVAFIHPDATECMEPFVKLEYEIHIKNTPIDPSQIKTEFLRERVVKTGCCGEKEFLKLHAYTLVNYEIVVHLDLDSLILQPLDDLFNSMLLEGDEKKENDSKLPVMFNDKVPQNIEAYFTRDYNMANLGKQYINVQGGFLVVRPNLEYFEEYKRTILEGDFQQGRGWGGKYGGYFGGQQIQGLCSYFFDGLHPGTAVELNRCIYNAMNDSPKKARKKGDTEVCIDGRDTCEDCRQTDISLIKSVHFTICQKPWVCPRYIVAEPSLCTEFHRKWFLIREDFEKQQNTFVNLQNQTDFYTDVFRGYCTGGGERNYIAIKYD